MSSWDDGHGARQKTRTPPLVNIGGSFKVDTVSPRHQRERLLRLGPEFISIVFPARPDDQLKVRTPIEEVTVKQPIDFVPISPEVDVEKWLDRLERVTTQVEHELRETERSDGQKAFLEGYCGQF